MYPSDLRYDKEEIHELLTSRINNLINGFKTDQKILDHTKEAAKISKDFIQKYDFIKKERLVFLVNSFWEIGMADPFPDDEDLVIGSVDDVPDDFKIPTKVNDYVYGPTRYIEGNSPVCIYIPAPEIMLKIMRACIDCKNTDELWFNQPSIYDKPPKVETE